MVDAFPGAMPKPHDPTGNFPDVSPVALILLDVINDLEFEGGERLLRYALPMACTLKRLKADAEKAGVACVYVNDNFGRWRSDFKRLVRHCVDDEVRGRDIARRLQPAKADYFVLKPKNSAFYGTTLDALLQHLQTHTIILTGTAG